MLQALAVFEQAQFLRRVDQHIGIGADAEASIGGEIIRRRKDAVSEIGFGDRAEPGDRAAFRQLPGFAVGHVRRVHQAPALIDRGVVE